MVEMTGDLIVHFSVSIFVGIKSLDCFKVA